MKEGKGKGGRPTVELPMDYHLAGTDPMAIATLGNEAASLGKQELLLDFTREC